jgi:archaellum biogenesis ATPase FlaH
MRDSTGMACIYCYCNYKEQKTQTVSELIASLLKQLVQDHPAISDNVESIYNHHIVQNTRPTANEFTKALRSEIGRYSKVFIIIDALDEFLERDQEYLITELRSLSSTVNLMVTSRPLPLIEEQFRGVNRLDILANEEDIRKYIETRTRRERRLMQHVKKDGTLLETMVDRIGMTARGMCVSPMLAIRHLV